ncbi:acetoacetate decarboxylase family protein [Nocardioides sp. KIGAM211]|uniref:Acetoacetate decarboxylase family protein n=1 Tax=Nocardioides luti TaxID=2761101 RepID=A0A7X0RLG7_9ACTN|nr:acetoacetate decarboxylase family protein [Nocardioides luti]MBB6629183.1 acetoacetate decarboxylase family protein [Nocardioides luti]
MSTYPPAPWPMVGQMWLSLFRVKGVAGHPDGIHGAAFVSYEEGSSLTYSELLVAHPVRSDEHGRRVSISNIWVDSPASMLGGRELWAIPKDLCDFTLESSHTGPLCRTEWSASAERRPIAHARFTDVSRAAVRLPFRGGTWQPGIAETGGEERTATMRGSARTLPCRGTWEFAGDGPLGWLRGQRAVASVRMAGFRMSFG